MTIRPASWNDIPEIVALLKLSLGESLMPKTVEYWRWKHVDNPFGESPVLLAINDEQIVGVRAFMRWKWCKGNTLVNTVRAVDTATHPAHQGRGIFSKLTKGLIEQSLHDNVELIFNTPNEKSKPGYLKMGWEIAGKLPITVAPVFRFFGGRDAETPPAGQLISNASIDKLISKWLSFQKKEGFRTFYSQKYLQWRYVEVPVADYFAVDLKGSNELDGLAIYRIKNTRFGKELRVTDFFYVDHKAADELYQEVKKKAWAQSARFISFARSEGRNPGLLSHVVNMIGLGPDVTVRNLKSNHYKDFVNFARWSPSLGDMELF